MNTIAKKCKTIAIILFHKLIVFSRVEMGRYTGKKCRLISMFWLTTIFFIVEIVVGYVTNSMALVADSFHMLSDVAALVVAFLSVKVISTLFIF